MNEHLEKFITSLEDKLPNKELISSLDLVKCGMATNTCTLARWRKKGEGPNYVRLSEGQIFYIKSEVIEWLRKSYQNIEKKK